MASQPSGSKSKKGFRSFLKETLHVRSRSKSPSQPSRQQTQQPSVGPGLPSGPAGTSKTPNPERLDGKGSEHEAREDIPPPTSPLNAAWAELELSLRSLKNAAGAFPALVSAVELLLSCLEDRLGAVRELTDYEDRIKNLTLLGDSLERLIKGPETISATNAVHGIIISIQDQVANLKAGLERGITQDSPPGEHGQRDLDISFGGIQMLFRQLEVNLDAGIWILANESAVNSALKDLNPVKHYTYNSGVSTDGHRTCTEGTRTELLAQLNEWLQDPMAAAVYWISGTEGTGKTTIARTFCDRADAHKLLAASFFCSRNFADSRDTSRVLPAIAYQVAQYSFPFQRALYEMLSDDPSIMLRDVREQFEVLRRSLATVKDVIPGNMVVLLDGLDEFEDRNDQRLLIDPILQHADELPLKFLLTSRRKPEGQSDTPSQGRSFIMIHLDDIARPLTLHDLKYYFKEELGSLAPTATQLERLVDRTDMLFICASILVRFILLDSPRSSPQERLELILSMTLESTKKHAYIDALYEAILRSVLEEEAVEETKRRYVRMVLWTVLFAQESVGVDTIATLAGIDDLQDVRSALQPLQPVLHHSAESGLVIPLHASFPEFMLNSERSGIFFYDIAEHSRLVATRCFGVMEAGLRFNICGLKSSFIPDREAEHLEDRVRERVSPTLAYACRYWASHLELSAICDRLRSGLEEFLSNRLLFWMEVLNLRKEIGTGVKALMKTNQWLKIVDAPPHQLALLVRDACDFVTSYAANPISECTPHIYLSALPFCPPSSRVYQIYSKRTTGLLDMQGNIMEHRQTAPLAVWKVGHAVSSIAYSADGNSLAFGRKGGPIGIRNAHDGSMVAGPSKSRIESVSSVAFSPDGSKLAVGSKHGIIEIWNVVDWEPIADPLQGHTHVVMSIAFSPDGTLIASSSRDTTVRIWNVKDGTLVIGPLEGHADWKTPVAFSPNGTQVASASADYEVWVWDIREDTPTHTTFVGHTYVVASLAFTPDGSRLVSGSGDHTARVWSTSDSASTTNLSISHPHQVDSVAILPNGRHVASSAGDHAIRVWDIEDGAPIAGPFFGHQHFIDTITISPDGTRIASGSDDQTIRIWAVNEGVFSPSRLNQNTFDLTSIMLSPSESRIYSTSRMGANLWNVASESLPTIPTSGVPHSICSLPVSPDGASIAMFLDDHSVEVVSTKNGKHITGPLRGHTDLITSAAFSSDGNYLITGSKDRTVRVWCMDNGRLTAGPFVGHTDSIVMVSLSFDGSRAVSCSLDSSIRVWNARGRISDAEIPPESHSLGDAGRVFEGWTVRDDGWVINHESSLLFWIPLDFPARPSPHTELIVNRHHGSLTIPKQRLLLGPKWDDCYISKPLV